MKLNYKHNVLVAAHRGDSAHFPENTLSSFKSALNYDIDMVETDLHMTKDGEIVLMHDHSVDRTTDGKGEIRNMTLAEIKKLDAGNGEKVPSFDEFMSLFTDRRQMLFNIELKDYPKEYGSFAFESCDKIISLIEKYGIGERCVLNSFSGELLEYIDRKYNHKYRLHGYFPKKLLGNISTEPYSYLYCVCLFGENGVADKKHFNEAISYGVEPWVYYPEEDETVYKKSVENGAVLFTANDPKRAIEILNKLKVR